jgi:ribitol 2-dehydrogenase
MSQELAGKVVAVTGAASGIGRACAEAYVAAGARVFLVDRAADELDRICAELGETAMPLVVDLLDPRSIEGMMPQILERAGQLDVFHANAGSYVGGYLLDTHPDEWDRMLNLNVNAVFRCVHAVLPHMVERKTGDVIVTSSVSGHGPIEAEPVYTASKHATYAFVHTVRRQFAKHGIRVGAVSPGPVNTTLLKDWPKERFEAAKAANHFMEPSAIAEAVMFMLTRPRTVTIRDIVILPAGFDV